MKKLTVNYRTKVVSNYLDTKWNWCMGFLVRGDSSLDCKPASLIFKLGLPAGSSLPEGHSRCALVPGRRGGTG